MATAASRKEVPMTLKDILTVPNLGRCLFSTFAARREGPSCFFNQQPYFVASGEVAHFTTFSKLYCIAISPTS